VHHNSVEPSAAAAAAAEEKKRGRDDALNDARDDVLLQFLRHLSPTVNQRDRSRCSLAPPLPGRRHVHASRSRSIAS